MRSNLPPITRSKLASSHKKHAAALSAADVVAQISSSPASRSGTPPRGRGGGGERPSPISIGELAPEPEPQPARAQAQPQRRICFELHGAKGLPKVEMSGIDAYAKVWHQHDEPPREEVRATSRGALRRCCGAAELAEAPVMKADHAIASVNFGRTQVVVGDVNPRWHFSANEQIAMNYELNYQRIGAGWLVVEILDFDRLSDDDCVGRVVIDLSKLEIDQVHQGSGKVSWAPEQTAPEPSGEIQFRLLISSLPDGFPSKHDYLGKSYDFLSLYEHVQSHSQYQHEEGRRQQLEQMRLGTLSKRAHSHNVDDDLIGEAMESDDQRASLIQLLLDHEPIDVQTSPSSPAATPEASTPAKLGTGTQQRLDLTPAENAPVEWRLGEALKSAFVVFDVNGDDKVGPNELMHVMTLLGENMLWDEIGQMIGEVKSWATGEGHVRHTRIDLSSEDSLLSEQEFQQMLTRYWCGGKYGQRTPRGKFRRKMVNKRHTQDRRETVTSLDFGAPDRVREVQMLEVVGHEKLGQDSGARGRQLPTPSWLSQLSQSHEPLPFDKRVPDIFWDVLRRKVEQMLILKDTNGLDDVGLFRKELDVQ